MQTLIQLHPANNGNVNMMQVSKRRFSTKLKNDEFDSCKKKSICRHILKINFYNIHIYIYKGIRDTIYVNRGTL